MKRVIIVLIAAGAIAAAVVGTPSVAATLSGAGGPHLRRASGIVAATVVSDDSRLCTGSDGKYLSLDVVLKGSQTSPDPRLVGAFSGHVQGTFKEQPGLDLLIGTARDDFEIRDPQGALKLKGTAMVVGDGVKALKGLLLAKLADGSTLMSTVNGLQTLIIAEEVARQAGLGGLGLHAPFVVEFGGAGSLNATDQGVIQHGACPGGFDPATLVPAS